MQLGSIIDRIRTFEPTLRGYGIDRLYIFGSYAREEAAARSDLDLLVHFRPGHRGGYFDMARVKRALEDDLGVTVDVQIAKGELLASEALQNTARVF
jgi:predicted nucleotidyltransferase